MMLVGAVPAHIPPLAASMREMDRIECEAMGHSPAEALSIGLSRSMWALTALVDDEPVAMLGVAPRSMIEGVGVPWMLGSDAIYDGARELVTYGPGVIREMESIFPRLVNMVAASNTRAISFLRHWGWRISSNRVPVGGVDFVEFSNRV
jgi:hypothetical protein